MQKITYEYIRIIIFFFIIPSTLYYIIDTNPYIGKNAYGETIHLGSSISKAMIFLIYVLLYLIYKYKSDLKNNKIDIDKLKIKIKDLQEEIEKNKKKYSFLEDTEKLNSKDLRNKYIYKNQTEDPWLGELTPEREQLNQSLENINLLTETHSKPLVELLEIKAEIFYLMNDIEKAIEINKIILSIDNKNTETYNELYNLYIEQRIVNNSNNSKEVIKLLKKARKFCPSQFPYNILAEELTEAGLTDEIKDYYRKKRALKKV